MNRTRTGRRNRMGAMFAAASLLALAQATSAQTPTIIFTATNGLSGFSGTAGHVAANSRGDVFLNQNNNGQSLVEYTASGQAFVTLISGMGTTSGNHGAFVDKANNVYVADTGDASIVYVPFNGGTYATGVTYASLSNCSAFPVPASQATACKVPLNYPYGYSQPADIALDGSGNLYMISQYSGGAYTGPQYNFIYEFAATTGVATTIASNLSNQTSAELAVSSAGGVYYVDGTNASYYAPGTTTPVSMGTFISPSGISIDGGGNLVLTDAGGNSSAGAKFVEFPVSNGTITFANQYTFDTGFGSSYSTGPSQGVGITGTGKIYFLGAYPNSLNSVSAGSLNLGNMQQYYTGNEQEIDAYFPSAATVGSFVLTGGATANFTIITSANQTTSNSSTNNNPNASTCVAAAYAAGSSCKVYVNYIQNSVVAGVQTIALQALDSSSNVLASASLYGIGNPAALNIDGGTGTAIGSGWNSPSSIAIDYAGNIFIADKGDGTVSKSVGGATPTVVVSGLSSPTAVALDPADNLYIADAGEVLLVPYSSAAYGTKKQILTGLSGPSGLALSGAGVLYVADSANARVLQLSSSGGQSLGSLMSTVSGSFTTPVAVAVDNNGSLFVSDAGARTLVQINLKTSAATTLLSGLTTPAGVGVDESGSVFIADSGAKTIKRIPNVSGTFTPANATLISSPVATPQAIALPYTGSIFVTDATDQTVGETNRTGAVLNFGNVLLNTTPAHGVTLTNAGYSQFNFYGYDGLSGALGNGFAVASQNCGTSTINVGASCTGSLTFTPTATGSQGWTVGMNGANNAGSAGNFIALSGNGVSATITGPASAIYGASTTYTVMASTNGTYTVSITGTATSSTSVTVSGNTGTFTLPALGVGSYTLSVTVGGTTATAPVAITPAPLSLTANSFSRIFDVANPALTFGYSGFISPDNSSVVTGTPSITTAATRVSPAAIYQIVAAAGTATAANYTISPTNGSLNVTGNAPQTIVFSALPNFTHGSTVTLTAYSTSGLPITYTASGGTIAGQILTVGAAGTVTVTATQAGNASYAAATSAVRSFTAQ